MAGPVLADLSPGFIPRGRPCIASRQKQRPTCLFRARRRNWHDRRPTHRREAIFSPISSATIPPPTPTTRCRYPRRHRRANRRPRHAGPTIIRGPPIITTTTSRRTQPTTIRTTIRVRRRVLFRRQQRGQQQRAAAFPVKILFVENRRLRPRPRTPARPPIRTRRLPVRRHRTVRPMWCRPRSRWQFPSPRR